MTRSQKLALRQREIRSRLSEIADLEGDALTDAIRSEGETLDREYRDVETRLSAAVIAEGAGDGQRTDPTDPADREYRALLGRGSVGAVLSAVIGGRAVDGADAELQQHHKLAPNEIAIELLRPRETRAVTPAPGSTGVAEDAVTPPVFAAGDGAFLGIYRPTVAAGDAVYPVLTSRPTVRGPHADDTDAGETTGAFDADLLAPQRIQASFFWKRNDAARFRGMEDALRSALNMGIEEKLDYEAIAGASGLLNGANLTNHNAAAVTTFAQYVSQFCFGRVDGRYARNQSDLRVLLGAATYAHAGATYRHANADDNALDRVEAKVAGVMVSAHVPAVAANKQNNVIRLGMRSDMVQPMWQNVALIVDEVTRSGKGEIEVTAVALMNTKITRSAGFYKQQTQHA